MRSSDSTPLAALLHSPCSFVAFVSFVRFVRFVCVCFVVFVRVSFDCFVRVVLIVSRRSFRLFDCSQLPPFLRPNFAQHFIYANKGKHCEQEKTIKGIPLHRTAELEHVLSLVEHLEAVKLGTADLAAAFAVPS